MCCRKYSHGNNDMTIKLDKETLLCKTLKQHAVTYRLNSKLFCKLVQLLLEIDPNLLLCLHIPIISSTHLSYACVCAQLCLAICDLMDCSPPGSSVHGILQARILKWVSMPSSRASSQPRDRTYISCVSCIAGGFFTTEPPWKPTLSYRNPTYIYSSGSRKSFRLPYQCAFFWEGLMIDFYFEGIQR